MLGGPKGGIAAIVCDTLKNVVRQSYYYTYLAIRGPISPGTLREKNGQGFLEQISGFGSAFTLLRVKRPGIE